MAARIDATPNQDSSEVVDLRCLRADDLGSLLTEEIQTWLDTLVWDFSKSADLVRRFVDLRALNGCALVENGAVTGYSYYVIEDHKGLVGDLYVCRRRAGPEAERRLLEWVLGALMRAPRVIRVESQLMMMASARDAELPYARYASSYERKFMMLDLSTAPPPPAARASGRRRAIVEKWTEHYQEAAAHVIAAAYAGHVDSLINDQYRSLSGARRFLFNIVQYPGCGTFFKPASFGAFDAETGRLCGLSLASLVSADCGHITQICVTPGVRGTGVGYELLRHSLEAFHQSGCGRVSLTVTAANRDAVRLYKNVGFSTLRKFHASVWEGF